MSKWPTLTLGELTDSTRPICYGVLKPGPNVPDGVPLVKIVDMQKRSVQVEGLHRISAELDQEFSRSRLRGGEVLLSIQGTIGRVAIAPMELAGANISRTVALIAPDERLIPEYLAYLLESMSNGNEFQVGGSTRDSLNIGDLRQVEVPLPPLEEQKRIVAKLDDLERLAKQRQAMALDTSTSAQDLFMSYLYDMFDVKAKKLDWPMVPFGEFAEHSLGKMLDKGKNLGEPSPYVRNANVQWFEIDTVDIQKMRIEDRERGRFSVLKGDLLICEGGYPGRCAIWHLDEEMYFQKALHRARFNSLGSAKWAMYLLYFMSETGRLAQHFSGTGIQHLTGERLARILVPMPSADVRGLLVNRIERVHHSVNEITAKQAVILEDLERLKEQTSAIVLNGTA